MIKKLCLALSLVILLSIILSAVSCGTEDDQNPELTDEEAEEPEVVWEDTGTIFSPEHKDYGRPTVNFDEIEYIRPDVDAIANDFLAAAALIEENKEEYPIQLAAITALEPHYYDYTTAYSYVTVKNSENRADEKWKSEHSYITSMRPKFLKATEKLFVAAALSPLCDSFEADYFGNDALESYKGGAKYTDELVSLLAEEAALENEYSALTTQTVFILYNGTRDTAAAHLERIKGKHNSSKQKYKSAYNECMELYKKELSKKTLEIYTELVKIRRKIADAYGYESYAQIAYADYMRDYSEEDMLAYIESVSEYILPVYTKLENSVFLPYFKSNESCDIKYPSNVMNSLYSLYSEDQKLSEPYSYMLQHKLYNYERANPDRFSGSFTVYLDNYKSPFIFISATGERSDYMTLAHEFGHFYDAYVNYGKNTSLDLEEVSSTALEFLTILSMENKIDDDTYKYLYYSAINDAMKAIAYQSTYSLFEHYVYGLAEDEISEKAIKDCARKASLDMGFCREYPLEFFMVPHTVLYPFYVQSYATSSAISFEILFAELEEAGAGVDLYHELVTREARGRTLEEELFTVGISSPFDDNTIEALADKIHFAILGAHYFNSPSFESNAA